ncbi:thioredoxin domain-containing protein [Flavisphingomonas formosensis]|uniref:thioredoxin domain-containing protein n=1 Tax=Flavisphingomonas formosensis TaxID=861534 RepID=UPI0012FA202D|nr:thioredoxin domain-containing protein [Sphingomonas formosensis]
MTALRAAFAAALLLIPASAPRAVRPAHAAHASANWTSSFSISPAGGFVMGNPKAPVRLVEFASLTCPHCAAFSAEGAPALRANYIAKGLVSYEVRPLTRDRMDLVAFLLARCGGPPIFFPALDTLFAHQADWLEKAASAESSFYVRLESLPPEQMLPELAKSAGLDAIMLKQGVDARRQQACLVDKGAQQQLAGMKTQAEALDVQGTPGFLINGALVRDVAGWGALEPALRKALNLK